MLEPSPPPLVPHLAVLPRLGLALIPIGLYTYAVSRIEQELLLGLNDLGLEASILSGIILSILLGFRNTAADSRWWEARTLWGQLVNETRNLCIKIASAPLLTAADRERAAQLLANFPVALKDHLRGVVELKDPPRNHLSLPFVAHVPQHIAGEVYDELVAWRSAGKIDGYDLLVFEPHARSLMDVCGACERIRTTPLATSYRALLRIGIGVYLIVSPIYVARDFNYWAVPVMLLVSFFMLGVEMVAHDVEEPFGAEGDDLPLEKYCDTIGRSVRQALSP